MIKLLLKKINRSLEIYTIAKCNALNALMSHDNLPSNVEVVSNFSRWVVLFLTI